MGMMLFGSGNLGEEGKDFVILAPIYWNPTYLTYFYSPSPRKKKKNRNGAWRKTL